MSEEKIGMYTTEEIYEELANGFLHHSMVDAMYFKIKDLQQKVEQLENENFNIRENIHLERISLPPELTKDKNFMELYDIPSYEDLKNKVEQLENIIDVKKYDYDYLETLFSKSSKEEMLKAYTYKCEQLEKVTEARNEFEMKAMKLENIRKEAIEYVKYRLYTYCDKDAELYDEIRNDLSNILNKGSDKE